MRFEIFILHFLFIFMSTLYRKYRPKDFSEVVGQNHIKVTLENEIKTGSVAHAYLFCGPRAVGKTTFSRILAKAVNCDNRKENEFEPCNKCDSCLEISDNRSLDIMEIDAASHTGVDNVRDNIIASARVAPSKRKYKVFIIDEVHMLSISAFNALLKVMEEPPANVIFILCTTEVHKVPSTIISRCQRFDFKRIGLSDVVKKLKYIIDKEGVKASNTVLENIARQADGHMRDAESLLGQIIAISGKEISEEEADLVVPRSDVGEAINLIDALSKKDSSSAIVLINKLVDNGVDLDRFATDLIEVLRKLLLAKVNPGLGDKLANDYGESFEMRLTELVKVFDLPSLILMLEKFIETKKKIKSSLIIQLPLEMAVVEICNPTSRTVPVSTSIPTRPQIQTPPETPRTPVPEAVAPGPTPPAQTIKTSGNISKDELISRWNEFLAKIKVYNHSLSFVLRVCQPRSVDNGTVCLAFKYKFHRDRISDISIRGLVEKTLAEVYGHNLTFEAILDDTIEAENATTTPAPASMPVPTPPPVPDTPASITGDIPEPAPQAEVPATPASDNGGDMMQDLLNTFGGKVVG